jgi:hydroxyacylglutathione hydrolase
MADIIQINNNTWRMEDNGVRFFLLVGTEKALLIDSGMKTQDAKQIAESITKLPIMLLNTHADPDHISGNGSFEHFYMHPDEEEYYRPFGGPGTIVPVSDNDIIDLGDRPLKIIFIPGHTPGSIAVLDINNRALISGDSIQDGDIYMFSKYRNMTMYVESMKKLSMYNDEFDTIYPSHGSFPVSPDLTAKLIEGAEQIINGTAKGEVVEMFGSPVNLYKFPYAGFLCDIR